MSDRFQEGLTYFKEGKLKQASEIFLEIVQEDNRNHNVWNALGVTLSKLGNNKNAKTCFENALIIDPDNATYQKNLDILKSKEQPIKKIPSKPAGKPSQKKKKRPITDYLIAIVGIFLFFVVTMIIFSVLLAPHPTTSSVSQPVQTVTPPTIVPSIPATTIPTPIPTPTVTIVFPSPSPSPSIQIQPTVSELMTVRFLDVGQGDSILLQAGGKNMLIDAGSASEGDTIVSDLRSAGVSSLDMVVSSHPHEDHLGGMISVLDAFPVGMYIDSGATHTSQTYENVMKKLVAEQTPYTTVATGKTFAFDGATIEVLNPSELSDDLNSDSVALKVTYGSVSFLLPGDTKIVATPATILKVPHHGSDGSTTNLNSINPEIAVIEVGSGNTYGHPAERTITDLMNSGVEVYRTDLNGDIIITTNGRSYSVTPEKESLQNTPTPATPVFTPEPTQIIPVAPVVQTQPIVTPTQSSSGVCDCSGDRYNCPNFPLPGGVTGQQCYDFCNSQGRGDVHGLDGDNDGFACEGPK